MKMVSIGEASLCSGCRMVMAATHSWLGSLRVTLGHSGSPRVTLGHKTPGHSGSLRVTSGHFGSLWVTPGYSGLLTPGHSGSLWVTGSGLRWISLGLISLTSLDLVYGYYLPEKPLTAYQRHTNLRAGLPGNWRRMEI